MATRNPPLSSYWRGRELAERRPVAEPRAPALEACPAHLARQDFPKYGGTVGFDSEGVGFCNSCGWRGVPSVVGEVILTICPRCGTGSDDPPPAPARVPRNAPCPCGSGLKAKRCGCAAFVV